MRKENGKVITELADSLERAASLKVTISGECTDTHELPSLAAARRQIEHAIKKVGQSVRHPESAGEAVGRLDTNETEHSVRRITEDEITSEADHIATQISDLPWSGPGRAESSLHEFATDKDYLALDVFNEHIDGNIASMVQVMIDKLGGVSGGYDEELVVKLNHFYGEYGMMPKITTLGDTTAHFLIRGNS